MRAAVLKVLLCRCKAATSSTTVCAQCFIMCEIRCNEIRNFQQWITLDVEPFGLQPAHCSNKLQQNIQKHKFYDKLYWSPRLQKWKRSFTHHGNSIILYNINNTLQPCKNTNRKKHFLSIVFSIHSNTFLLHVITP